jgi:hypothetical protein
MISLKKDSKSPLWTITVTDSEGFHRQVNVSSDELDDLMEQWERERW